MYDDAKHEGEDSPDQLNTYRDEDEDEGGETPDQLVIHCDDCGEPFDSNNEGCCLDDWYTCPDCSAKLGRPDLAA